MKSLLLSGYNIHMHVKDDKLIVMDGKGWNKEPTEMIFRLNMMNYDNIIIYGNSGNVDLSAIHWLMEHDVSVNIMNSDGTYLTSMNPPHLKSGHVKMSQYKAHENNRIFIGKRFIEAKVKGIETIMKWLDQRYIEIGPHIKKMDIPRVLKELNRSKTDKDILKIDSDLSDKYWLALKEVFSEKIDGKNIPPGGAGSLNVNTDPLKTVFNYGHAVLESICLRAVNGANLDPYIGFIHRMKLARSPLVEDLKGPYQWLADKTIINCIENSIIRRSDLIRNNDGTIQMTPDGLRRLINEFDRTFSQSIKYRGRNHQWYVMVQIKVQELSQYLMNNIRDLDLNTPEPYIESIDSREMRNKILKLSYSDWIAKGYTKSSLAYLKTQAKSNKPLKLKKESIEKIKSIVKDP